MLINENLILLDFEAATKDEAIRQLALMAAKEGKLASLDDYTQSVMEREKTYTTGVGNGIAIPHGKSKAVKEAMIVFGKSKTGIEWDAADGSPVNMIFLLGVPEENVDNFHLKVLSQLSRKLMDDDFVESLKKANSRREVLNALKDIKAC
ncbi:phosphotransferase/anion transporter [Lucifera butyrica]|uniref:Phosphotransferase/anion transporter n=1 Tax=Lucifera butyrica TaxID=1351585 RepID=A0A498R915_9FIRM|nr:PTS sugar transporter subunit IIA [Lucifera butyrica]VBB06633.1 phosphotransferase/anion transporter [Lucifera butyrica]